VGGELVPPRVIDRRYEDPLDIIWRHASSRVGMRLKRSDEVFASWDGQGTLTLSSSEHFDADDSLAQLIFHEMCHALVEGAVGQNQPDWGLCNTDERDLVREHAAHRLQAALTAPWGLRAFFAVTTQWRPYYDALPDDPLQDGADPAIVLAQAASKRAAAEPWSTALQQALCSTAAVADLVRDWSDESSLWRGTERPTD
jgi:hypothetical protein